MRRSLFDQSGLGDAAAELLPKTPPHVGVCLIGSDLFEKEPATGVRGDAIGAHLRLRRLTW